MTYISIRQVIDNLLADNSMKKLSLERAVNYAVEFIRVVGMPQTFVDKVERIKVYNHRAQLPCDFIEATAVRHYKGPAYTYATGSFGPQGFLTYKIQGNVIFTSDENPEIEIAYRALNLDEDGFPLIIDNGTFARALELYIQKRWFTILFNNGEIDYRVLQNIQQEYGFAVKTAQSDLVRPSVDQMESITRMWNSLIQKNNKHLDSFNRLNRPDLIK